MIDPRLDPEEVELRSLEGLVEELESDSEDVTEKSLTGTLWRYGSSLAEYMNEAYENIDESDAITSSVTYDTEGIAENVGAWDRHWSRVLGEINDFYSDERFYDSPTLWDGGVIPELTDRLEEVDREEYLPREKEVDEIKEIIRENGPVQGPKVRDIFEERNDYRLTTTQLDSRLRDRIGEEVEAADEGYVFKAAQVAAAD